MQIAHRVTIGEKVYGLVRRATQVAGKALGMVIAASNDDIHAREQHGSIKHTLYFFPGVAGEDKDREVRLISYTPQERQERTTLLKRLAAADGDTFDGILQRCNALETKSST